MRFRDREVRAHCWLVYRVGRFSYASCGNVWNGRLMNCWNVATAPVPAGTTVEPHLCTACFEITKKTSVLDGATFACLSQSASVDGATLGCEFVFLPQTNSLPSKMRRVSLVSRRQRALTDLSASLAGVFRCNEHV
jgi:hypothetical protein